MLAMRDDDLTAALVASMEKHQLIITRHLDKLQDFTLFSDKISGASLLFLFVKSDVSWSSWLGSDGIWDGGHGLEEYVFNLTESNSNFKSGSRHVRMHINKKEPKAKTAKGNAMAKAKAAASA